LVGTCAHDVESSVLLRSTDIEIACHDELLAFTVFGHFREEAGELDEIATDRVRGENFATFNISQVFPVSLVFHFEVFGGDVADFVAVGGDVDFKLVIFVGEGLICDVNGYAAEALVQYLVMNSARIDGYSRTTF
jgi:hypothetical protein